MPLSANSMLPFLILTPSIGIYNAIDYFWLEFGQVDYFENVMILFFQAFYVYIDISMDYDC